MKFKTISMKTRINKTSYFLLLIMITVFAISPVLAQDNEEKTERRGQEERFERLQSMKVAYITEELKLTPAEAEKFWPLHNEFEAKRREIAKSMMHEPQKERKPDFDNMSDEQISEHITLRFKEERAMIDLQEEYYDKYRKVLPLKKVAKYYESEKRFRSHLLNQIRTGKYRGAKEEYQRGRENR